MKVTFLGTGTSHGIPVIGCSCRVCRSDDPKDSRWRASVYIANDQESLVIDTPPEFRLQMLRARITSLHAVCFTHGHADHVFGIDDLRTFTREQTLPLYADRDTLLSMQKRFDYLFSEHSFCGSRIADLHLQDIDASQPVLGGMPVIPVPVLHGRQRITGYRIGPFAYLTDCSGLPDESWGLLEDLEVLVIGALRYRPHPTHYSIPQVLEVIKELNPRIAYLTHMCHDVSHAELERKLPHSVRPAFDGLTIELPA